MTGFLRKICFLALFALPTSAVAQGPAAAPTPEQKILQKINQDRKAQKIMPCSEESELSQLAAKELNGMMENPQLAQSLKQRLKNHPLLKIGYSSLLFAAPNEKAITVQMAKQKSYQYFLNKEIDSLGMATVKADSDPPFYQVLIIGAKAQPKDPCNGQPGLSDNQVNHAKHLIDSQAIACYNKALEKDDPNIRGRITYTLLVAPDGSVNRDLIYASEELKPLVFPCVDRIMANQLKFPKPCGTKPVTIMSFGWDFNPPQGDKRIGRLSKGEITGAIQRKRPQIQRCYEKALKTDKKLTGEMVLKFTIDAKGAIKFLAITKDTLNKPDVTSCIREQALKVLFPAPKYNGEVEFEFPLNFAPEK